MAEAALIGITAGFGAAAVVCLAAGVLATRWLGQLTAAARGIGGSEGGEHPGPRPPGPFGALADAIGQSATRTSERAGAADQERERIAAVLNSTADAVLAIDAGERITFANLAAERLLDRRQDELLGQPVAWAMPQPELLDALRASGDGARTALVQRGNRHIEVTTTPIVGGGDWAALIVCHDLTDVKRTDEIRRDFVANVSHELRTPLAAVKSVIETLQAGALEDRAAAQDFLARADAEIERLVAMLEELLELSRIEAGGIELARQAVDVAAVLASAVGRLQPYAQRHELQLRLELPPALPPVAGDAERLERAAVNLVRNAIEFTPAGGTVRVSAAEQDGTLTVEVEDTGAGIAPEDLPRVFERFYKANRARGGGTGLGLAIVKHTVEAHGGSVGVESEQGRGSKFTITLPLAASPDEPSQR